MNADLFCLYLLISYESIVRTSLNQRVWKLKDTQVPMMNHPVGYFK
jgi:hypothetical protein